MNPELEVFTPETLRTALANVSGRFQVLSVEFEQLSRKAAELTARIDDSAAPTELLLEAIELGNLFSQGGVPNFNFDAIERDCGNVWAAATILKGDLIATKDGFYTPEALERKGEQQ